MFGSNILDVGIGLIFLFLLLSLVCSAANELIEIGLKKRAKDLEKGIKELIGSDGAGDFISHIYNHGLINSLYRGEYASTPKWKLPAYIPAKNFALALLEIKKAWPEKPVDAHPDPGTVGDPGSSIQSPLWQALPHNVETALAAIETAAAGDLAKVQTGIEDWYNSAMDRVSGWYKRRTQIFILIMGLGAAVLVNADCIQYAQRLSSDSSLRQSVVALAEATAKKDLPKPGDKKPVDEIKDNIASLSGIGLPIGWDKKPKDFAEALDVAKAHWAGWFLTALAISLGAPFWFDVLNKLIVVRSTVKPHEKSREESSKDAKK